MPSGKLAKGLCGGNLAPNSRANRNRRTKTRKRCERGASSMPLLLCLHHHRLMCTSNEWGASSNTSRVLNPNMPHESVLQTRTTLTEIAKFQNRFDLTVMSDPISEEPVLSHFSCVFFHVVAGQHFDASSLISRMMRACDTSLRRLHPSDDSFHCARKFLTRWLCLTRFIEMASTSCCVFSRYEYF